MKASRRIFPVIGICIGIMVGLLAGEVGLRIAVESKVLQDENAFVAFIKQLEATPVKSSIYRHSDDFILSLELIPGSHRKHIRVNSDGFRGKEYSREVPPGVNRIAFLGDSETFGAALNEDETITGCLEKALNDMAGKGEFEVLNFGFPGYNTLQELRVLKTKAIEFNPSIVVLYYVLNDPILAPGFTELRKRRFHYRSYLCLLAEWFLKSHAPSSVRGVNQGGGLREFYQMLHSSEYFDVCKYIIGQMGDFLHEREIRFVTIIAPEIAGYSDFNNYPYRDIHNKLLDLGSQRAEVFDPLDNLASSGYKPTDLWVTPTDCHKNRIANQIIAQAVAKHILSD